MPGQYYTNFNVSFPFYEYTLINILVSFGAGWYLINGVLHNIFVIKGHKTGYDRELLRLLMDGHVLILSGVLLLVSWWIARVNPNNGALVALVTALFMIVYCAMIFPFLKSFGTLLISILISVVSAAILLK